MQNRFHYIIEKFLNKVSLLQCFPSSNNEGMLCFEVKFSFKYFNVYNSECNIKIYLFVTKHDVSEVHSNICMRHLKVKQILYCNSKYTEKKAQ